MLSIVAGLLLVLFLNEDKTGETLKRRQKTKTQKGLFASIVRVNVSFRKTNFIFGEQLFSLNNLAMIERDRNQPCVSPLRKIVLIVD